MPAQSVKREASRQPELKSERAKPFAVNDAVERGNQLDVQQSTNVRPELIRDAQLQFASEASQNMTAASVVDIMVKPEKLIRTTEIDDIILAQLEVRLPAVGDLLPVVDESDLLKTASAEVFEDLGIVEADFEQAREAYYAEDTSLEDDILRADGDSLDELLAGLEEGMQQIEAEYIGELLVKILLDLEVAEELDRKVAEGDDIFPPSAVEAKQTLAPNGFEKEFTLFLEALEPTRAIAISKAIAELGAVITDSRQLPENATVEEKAASEQELAKLCRQLLKSFDRDYGEETLKQFMQIITEDPFINIDVGTEELSIDKLNSLGTREYRPNGNESLSLLIGLAQIVKQKLSPYIVLGRYVLLSLQPSF